MKSKIISTLIFAGFVLACFTASVRATNFIVTSAGDPDNGLGACASGGSCTIRQALNNALDTDAIIFNIPASDCPNNVCTINLMQSDGLVIKRSVTIVGPGAKNLIIKKADILFPFGFTDLAIGAEPGVPITVKISGVTIANGSSQFVGGIAASNLADITLDGVVISNCGGTLAGAIVNQAQSMTIINSTISGNGGGVGAIDNSGTLTIANSTISGNQGTNANSAGGIKNRSGATTNLNNVSIVNNSETSNDALAVGGIINNGGTVNVRNTVIAENTAPPTGTPDAVGMFTSWGSNFLSSYTGTNGFLNNGFYDLSGDSGLVVLSDNGGPTMTHATLSISPLIDHGNNCVINMTCPGNNPPVPLRFDQRGPDFVRNWSKTIDIGAYEFQQAPNNAPGVVAGRVFSASGGGLAGVRMTLTNMNGTTMTTTTNGFGYFVFNGVPVNQTITVAVSLKGGNYATQGLGVVSGANPDLNFYPQ